MVDKLWYHALSFLENYRYVLVIVIFSSTLVEKGRYLIDIYETF